MSIIKNWAINRSWYQQTQYQEEGFRTESALEEKKVRSVALWSCTKKHYIRKLSFSYFSDVMVATLQLPGTSGPKRDWFLEASMTPTLVSSVCERLLQCLVCVWCLQFWLCVGVYRLPSLHHPSLRASCEWQQTRLHWRGWRHTSVLVPMWTWIHTKLQAGQALW